MKKTIFAVAVLLLSAANAHALNTGGKEMDIKAQIAKFAPVEIRVDKKLINSEQKKLVDELVKAAHYMDEIFLRQVWSGNVKMREEFEKDGKKDSPYYEYFLINVGPFDRLNHNKPFIDGVPPKPAGANFYPPDITKKEFEDWIKSHPKDKDAFTSSFTVIKRRGKDLVAIPYSEEYREWLVPAAKHLKEAAKYAGNESLKKYLISRADAFLSNDYYASDVHWVHLKDHGIEVVFGPYETYEDDLMGYKAAFETFITRVDPVESARLSKVVSYIPDLEKHLPIPDEFKGTGKSPESPIVVTQEIYTAGDAKRGVQTLAFNLPNDERVCKNEGSKKVMLKNVQNAKFDKILMPIAKLMMMPADVANTSFEAFFAHTLLHEVSHGIGPGEIKKGGAESTVRKELKNLYSIIEECKADTLGIYNNVHLIDQGLYPKDFTSVLWPTYLAGIFRSVRFGINEAHGGGNVIQFNYLLDKGGFTYDAQTGLFGVDSTKIEKALKDLAHDLLMIEARGDYKAAKDFVTKYRVMRPELESALKRLDAVPVDIKPAFAYK